MKTPKLMDVRARIGVGVLALWFAVAALFGSNRASSEELGRLFFTPQQRQDLDQRRISNVVEAERVVESLVTVNGNVTRSGGQSTTWINGVAQNNVAGGRDPARPVIVDGESTIHVKVGQTFDRNQGVTRDPLGAGEIRITPQHGK